MKRTLITLAYRFLIPSQNESSRQRNERSAAEIAAVWPVYGCVDARHIQYDIFNGVCVFRLIVGHGLVRYLAKR